MNRRSVLKLATCAVAACSVPASVLAAQKYPRNPDARRLAFIVDAALCDGCLDCKAACSREKAVPDGFIRVERYNPDPRLNSASVNVPRLCNHCEYPVCLDECRFGAISRTSDGVVLIDEKACTGCGACEEGCPYDAVRIDNGKARKCDWCYGRLQMGHAPACVETCSNSALGIFDLLDDSHSLTQRVRREDVRVIMEQTGTEPLVFYAGLGLIAERIK